jgi:hypothetical protein
MIEQTVRELTPLMGTRPACRVLGAAPATIYRHRRPTDRRCSPGAHKMVCAGQIALRTAQRRIAADWEALYKSVYGRSLSSRMRHSAVGI